jgi:transposase InsO family protein
MKKYGLQARVKKRFIRTTDSNHSFPVYPNLIKGKTVTVINQVWVADITYIRILTGFVFLAVILDLFSRRVVGWAISKRIDHNLTVDALRVAIDNRKPPAGLIHHSDRGVQYACKNYIDLLKAHNIEISMSAKGNPYDNAHCESFMKTLKTEEVYLWEYENFIDVIERIPFFIEEVYNKKRVHSGIKYLPPEEFENLVRCDSKQGVPVRLS